MAYIINKSGGDFQQGGCLYKLTSGIQWPPKNPWMSDRSQKQVSAKADRSMFSSDVMVISIISKKLSQLQIVDNLIVDQFTSNLAFQ